jgi:hypothetical protein
VVRGLGTVSEGKNCSRRHVCSTFKAKMFCDRQHGWNVAATGLWSGVLR